MALQKDTDDALRTKGGATIRVETWVDPATGQLVKYNMAYINHNYCDRDNGRLLGYDDAHLYPGFSTKHHEHHCGSVVENTTFVSVEDQLERFQAALGELKQAYGKGY